MLFGDDIPATFYFGDSPVERLYFGDELVWTSAIDPQQLTYSTPGEYVFTTPDGSGYHVDLVAVGGGNGGHWYEFGRQHNGGKAGSFNWDSIVEGVDFTAGDQIAITVGAGGGGAGAGAASTMMIAGNTLTAAAGESGYLYGYAGQSVFTGNTNGNKDLLLNGVTYVGGSGGTGSGSNDSAASPLAPGGGGWGSNSNGVSGRPGGHGRVWLNVYQ